MVFLQESLYFLNNNKIHLIIDGINKIRNLTLNIISNNNLKDISLSIETLNNIIKIRVILSSITSLLCLICIICYIFILIRNFYTKSSKNNIHDNLEDSIIESIKNFDADNKCKPLILLEKKENKNHKNQKNNNMEIEEEGEEQYQYEYQYKYQNQNQEERNEESFDHNNSINISEEIKKNLIDKEFREDLIISKGK